MRTSQILDTDSLRRSLKAEISRSAEARFLHRLHCLLLMAEGYHCSEIARWFGEDPSTVARWVRHFIDFGTEGLREEHKPGRPKKLDPDQLRAIGLDVDQSPSELGYDRDKWDGSLLSVHLAERYDVSLSVRQCQRLLRQLKQCAAPGVTADASETGAQAPQRAARESSTS